MSSFQIQEAIPYAIFSVILLLILSFHIWRLRYVKSSGVPTHTGILCKYIELSHVSYIIIILPTIRCILMTIWHYIPSILNPTSCKMLIHIDASLWFAIMGFIHLFMAMRSRLNATAVPAQSQIPPVWFKIGLILILADFASMFYILTGQAFDVIHINNTCKPINISLILIIGTMCSSVIIGLYSLFVFVIPLQKYVSLENKLDANINDDHFLKTLVIKIIIYSSIMIISTLVVTFIVAFVTEYIEIVTALDNIINSYCILLQFRDIELQNINHKYFSKCIEYFQCKCLLCCIKNNQPAINEITMTKIVKLHKKRPTYMDTIDTNSYLPKLSIRGKPFENAQNSVSINSTKSSHFEISMTEHSNFHDDRKKYIKTILENDTMNNGVTGKFISLPIAETAYIFWQKNIGHLEEESKLEIACAIFFEMVIKSITKDLLKKHLITNQIKMETMSMKFLSMMEWLVKHLLKPNIDMFLTLQNLGKSHLIMNIEIKHFGVFLSAVHTIFEQYFETKYSIKEKYAMDKLFTIASQIMSGQDLHTVNIMNDFAESFDTLDFITSLESCLKSTVGSNYLHRFLQQTFCDELVIWLQSMKKFKLATCDKERFMIAKRMKVELIQPIAPFCINISHEQRKSILEEIETLEAQFGLNSKDFKVSNKFFDAGHSEIIRLIEQNHWKRFVDNINTFKNSSINLH